MANQSKHTPSESALEAARVILYPFRGIVTEQQIQDAAAVIDEQTAAPELLAALKAIVNAWLSPLEKRALTVEMCEAARTAIAKAEPVTLEGEKK